jgi:hypothetical protein
LGDLAVDGANHAMQVEVGHSASAIDNGNLKHLTSAHSVVQGSSPRAFWITQLATPAVPTGRVIPNATSSRSAETVISKWKKNMKLLASHP